VRAFELFGQVHEHSNYGHRVLDRMRLVPDLDGELQSAHANFVDPQLSVVAFALFVLQPGQSRLPADLGAGRTRFSRAHPARLVSQQGLATLLLSLIHWPKVIVKKRLSNL
jgi:hypothetical protein